MKTLELKREEAAIRQEKYNGLSIAQRIKNLDANFGKGKGAEKERAKLDKALHAKANAAVKEVLTEPEAVVDEQDVKSAKKAKAEAAAERRRKRAGN